MLQRQPLKCIIHSIIHFILIRHKILCDDGFQTEARLPWRVPEKRGKVEKKKCDVYACVDFVSFGRRTFFLCSNIYQLFACCLNVDHLELLLLLFTLNP